MRPGAAQAAGNVLEMALPARLKDAEAFIAALRGFLSTRSLEALSFALELLAREALVNAVRHGCQGDPARTITVRLSILRDRVRLCVSDQGPGFDWRNTPCTLPSPSCETGRGLGIMKKYADTMEFNAAGNTVCVTKMLPVKEGRRDE